MPSLDQDRHQRCSRQTARAQEKWPDSKEQDRKQQERNKNKASTSVEIRVREYDD